MKSICVFTGANRGHVDTYAHQATVLGGQIAGRGIRLVYGASRSGLMGVIADAALAGGGEVVGVIPESLCKKELMHEQLTETRIVKSMHERKATFAELSDGFIAMPGGLGTLEELFEVLTWAQLGFHSKAIGLLNVDGYFNPLLDFIDQAVENGFVAPTHKKLLLVDDEPEALLDKLLAYQLIYANKWIDNIDEL